MTGRVPIEIVEQFALDTQRLTTAELAEKYDKATTTIKDWRRDARDTHGYEVGYVSTEPLVRDRPEIEGLLAEDWQTEVEHHKALAIAQQRRYLEKMRKRNRQSIKLPVEPSGVAYFSDIHFGNPGTDYEAIYADAEIVARTGGLYAGFHGDGIDNWIAGRLQTLQRGQITTLEGELTLFSDWLNTINGKLLWVVSGNHENWTYQLAGIDILRDALSGFPVLYDPHEIIVDLRMGVASWTHKIRHAWRGNSIFNDTHGIEVGWERGGVDFDIGIGGHTHIGTRFRDFDRHGKLRLAVLIGTYKVDEEYGRQLGMAQSTGTGCGAVLYHPDGRIQACRDLETAADFLAFWRKSYR